MNNRVVWSGGLSVTLVSPAKTVEPIDMLIGLWARMGTRNHLLDGGPDPHGKGQFWGKGRPLQSICRERAKTAKAIDLPFELWTRVGRRKHKFNRIRQVVPMCPDERAHWRHRVNSTEPSVRGGKTVLCQITLTTCYYIPVEYYRRQYAKFSLVTDANCYETIILFNTSFLGSICSTKSRTHPCPTQSNSNSPWIDAIHVHL